jgi:hypothetical protein
MTASRTSSSTQAPPLPRTQNDLVLDHLRSQGPLTQPEAQDQLGCLRLGARIWDLRQRGHAIRTEFIELASGQRVARYSLAVGVPVASRTERRTA